MRSVGYGYGFLEIRQAFSDVAMHLYDDHILLLFCSSVMQQCTVYLRQFNYTCSMLLLNVKIGFQMRLGSYRPSYGVYFSEAYS